MYTCCPECETTFRLSADDLRLARGQVRCGECDHVFNALEYLSEENTEVEVAEAEAAVSDVSNDDTVFSLDTEPANDELAESPDDDATEDYGLDEESGLDDTGTGLLVTDEDDDDATKAWNEPADGEYEEEDAAAESVAIFGYADDDGLTPDEAEAEELVLADVEEEGEEGEGEEELEDDEFGYDIDSGETEESIFEVSDAEDETAEAADDESAEDSEEEPEEEPDEAPDEALDEETAEESEVFELEDDDSLSVVAEDDDEDFDDTIWERIPGVGSATYYTEDENDDEQGTGDEPDEPSDDQSDNLPEYEGEAVSACAENDEFNDTTNPPNTDELEFNVPEESWSNFFGPAPRSAGPPDWEKLEGTLSGDNQNDNEDAAAGEGDDADPDDSTGEREWEEITTGSWSSEALTPGDVTAGDVFAGEATEEIVLETVELNKVLEDYETTPPWQPESVEAEPEQPKPARTGLWLVIGVVLFIGFSTQLVHYNRDKLAAHPSFGGTVRSVYENLDIDTFPNWPISNYEIRGSEAVAGESGADVLDIRTQIAAVGDNVTGLPQLRVVLRDRWSNPVAARHFTPEEYMTEGELPADGLLRPNQTISAHVSIVDPGADAQGFELELCLPRRHTGLDCTGQPFQ
ncbi:MAG: DUF3426 domain-containing protein [Gammaproteobacteria bacterium]|nr:DUF3426 domain-containing protein [Gammaproteobacteria bacterium]